MLDTLLSWDTSVFLFVNQRLAAGVLDALFVVITNGKFWILPGVIAALVYLRAGGKRALLVLVLALATVALSDPLCAKVLKPLFHRLRPCNPEALVEGGRFLLGYKTSFSFPSSHAMNMFGQAVLFTCFHPRFAAWFFLFASVIGYSRVYTGVHYPLDVAGGAVFGAACGALVYGGYRLTFFFRRHKKERSYCSGVRHAEGCGAGPAGTGRTAGPENAAPAEGGGTPDIL
jgi:undecaprenyl-diphosphatase